MRIPALLLPLSLLVSCGAPVVQGGQVAVVPAVGTHADSPAQPATPRVSPAATLVAPAIALQVGVTTETLLSSLAILAVEDATKRGAVPVDFLRTALTGALMDRGFTPLGRGFVDGKVKTFPGGPSEVRIADAAVLFFQVLEWNGKHMQGKGRLQASGTLSVYGPGGELLHQARMDFRGALKVTQMSGMTPRKRSNTLTGQLLDTLLGGFPAPPPL